MIGKIGGAWRSAQLHERDAGAKSRSYLQALKLRLRLNDIAKIGGPLPDRPRRMHRQTYYRLCRRLEELEKKLGPRFRLRETDYGPWFPNDLGTSGKAKRPRITQDGAGGFLGVRAAATRTLS
jgi:hypothetical protein